MTTQTLIVHDQFFEHRDTLTLANGGELAGYRLAVQTYGELNESATNAILICHALTGNQHVTGKYSADDKKSGWWSDYVGPGKAIDTNHFFVVGVNNIGGCNGSTGPESENPDTGEPWAEQFPSLRVRDWVKCQHWLMGELGVRQWAAVVGGSLGGMQAMRWCVDYPEALRHCIVIASASHLTAQNIAFNELARQAIKADPAFHQGQFKAKGTIPETGVALARMIGHVTYLSGDGMNERFGRELRKGSFALGQGDDIQFQVESYLQHQGSGFANRFDANSYVLLTRVLDFFDLARDFNNQLELAFAETRAKFLVLAFSTDWRFSPQRSEEIVDALIKAGREVSYAEIQSDKGHDAFLIPNSRYEAILSAYMSRVLHD
ncbi:homoserine O-succinyltransferase MetX [Umboniibacter marinipuniceus]|uniref:Homoserine O-succinyltransferase n=1 Tax=Umboniibacter marinipuniceus TaxID=569599 RepID=A0A3M0ACD5_9GAMM|nr:homoserine O-acetyltransferase [Umboniibacter marinipuniceus]RMA82216.1 homoserine O-acetyltransferase [Umboniibacter marinipuniceus]